ncbi:MAG: zinc-binding alcohol dehydrogenase [Candidatus Methylacidiphilales bacterium]|nr:zinc-binding alcohol dehydrogenase [Candidatus Methylacidiphilales bacterium]
MQVQQVVITSKYEVELQSLSIDTGDLKANEVIVQTERTFISAGTELATYCAADPCNYVPGSWCAFPFKAGYGNVGRVLDAGSRYRNFIGKRVFTNAPHASAARYETDGRYHMLAEVPAGLTLEQAVTARMAMVSLASLDASAPGYMRWVVVIGLGMVGNLAAQLFHLTGAHVIGVDPSENRRQLARRCGIPHTVGGTQEEIAAEVSRLTGGTMARTVVDAVGHSSICLQAMGLAAQGGEVIVLGSPRADVTGNLTEVFRTAHQKWITVKGALEWSVPAESHVEHDHTLGKRLAGLFAWIADGRLKLDPLITHVLPPQQIKQAYEGLLHDKENYVGVVLNWEA